MGSVRIKIPGVAGLREARAMRVHAAVVAELARLEESRRPKPAAPVRKTFEHIRDYREADR
jgi:hypothetical protein